MVKLAPHGNSPHIFTIMAMTLVEVLVALAIVSFVFSSLTQMAFDALKKAKDLELQDKMRNYATEASQIIYNEKNVNWKNLAELELPPAQSDFIPSQARIFYQTDPFSGNIAPKIKSISRSDCALVDNVLVGQGCLDTAPPEGENRILFGRLIMRHDSENNTVDPYGTTRNIKNSMELQIIVACIKDRCDSKQYKPFILNLSIFRTSGG